MNKLQTNPDGTYTCAIGGKTTTNENSCPVYETNSVSKPDYSGAILVGGVIFSLVLLISILVVGLLILFRTKKK